MRLTYSRLLVACTVDAASSVIGMAFILSSFVMIFICFNVYSLVLSEGLC